MKKTDTSFTGLLGDSPRTRLLRMFIVGRDLEYSYRDLTLITRQSQPTLNHEVRKMLSQELLVMRKQKKIPGKPGKRQYLFRFNMKAPHARALARFFDVNLKMFAKKNGFKYDVKKRAFKRDVGRRR